MAFTYAMFFLFFPLDKSFRSRYWGQHHRGDDCEATTTTMTSYPPCAAVLCDMQSHVRRIILPVASRLCQLSTCLSIVHPFLRSFNKLFIHTSVRIMHFSPYECRPTEFVFKHLSIDIILFVNANFKMLRRCKNIYIRLNGIHVWITRISSNCLNNWL